MKYLQEIKIITCDTVLRLLCAISLSELNKGSNPGRICRKRKALPKDEIPKQRVICFALR